LQGDMRRRLLSGSTIVGLGEVLLDLISIVLKF